MKDEAFYNAYLKMILAKKKHRTIEQIVDELKDELKSVNEESFLIHAMRLISELESKNISSLYKHLQSPMKQTLYLIDVYYSIDAREESVDMDDIRWDRIAILLDEIEMVYFINVGFPNNGDIYYDERDKKIEVSLATFLGYFSNAILSYEEQTLDKIIRYLKPYDDYIRSHYGFMIDEALKFLSHLRILNNNKLNDIFRPLADTFFFYKNHPEEWNKLTCKFEERGINDPSDWCYQPELSNMLRTITTNPGEIHVHETEELMNVDINHDSLLNIIKFFSYDKDYLKGKTVYYADKHHSESHPLIKIDKKYICPINKFFLEGLFFRLDEDLIKQDQTGKYKQNKDIIFERKVIELFKQFFPSKAKIFSNYSVDNSAENDLLVIIGNTCIVVEIKNCKFREPFRDPIKAYERIKRDYQNAIQLGYNQCKRVENILLAESDVDVCDANNKKLLYHLKKKNINNVYSIVVTDFKYGAVQTDLSKLLEKTNDALYPWSVCADDLEVFFLLMKKILKGIAPARFIDFLDYRERLHGHVICFDELEICGWYLNDSIQFKEYANKKDMIITTNTAMGAIFDAYYRVGIGFKNELDLEYKKYFKMPNYPKKFNMDEITCRMKDLE